MFEVSVVGLTFLIGPELNFAEPMSVLLLLHSVDLALTEMEVDLSVVTAMLTILMA